jgi:hypothetical protein
VKSLPLMTGPELAAALDKIEEIKTWCNAVQAEAQRRAENKAPDAAPGWKLAEGRKGDRMADPEAILLRIKPIVETSAPPGWKNELYTTPQLKSVAQLEGACKRLGPFGKAVWAAIKGDPENGVCSLITQAAGRPTLVRDFDARPELAPQPVTFELRPVGAEFNAAPNLGAAEGLM